ncbi:hypothetical protein M413DRAFT_32124 [Hebeloma cylindrosporum]|uniref:F-box domain-containing protein n=1 Tax=Hebeloma cylindrosporum TaxID=76867 RepID=A0A0C3BWW7_HEBCY|nr:hypothetical protein M413DRAFT_32124 [Hebeloma cylindrosporum h7]
MPFLLGSVSRRWRQLARSTPQLWSTVSFTRVTRRGKDEPAPPPLQIINDWLQLSCSLPLTFCVVEDPSCEFFGEICRPVIDALNQHSGRWHKVSLQLYKHYLPFFCGTSPPNNLHTLEIGQDEEWDCDETPTTYFRMNSTPSPTRLAIEALNLLELDVSWGNVTCLTLVGLPPHECILATRLAPLLECCTLFELDLPIDDYSSALRSKRSFKNTRLRTLRLHGTADLLDVFIEAVEFPALEELIYGEEIFLPAHGFISLFNRSGNCLKKLTLNLCEDSGEIAENLMELLEAIPSLEHLECVFPIRSSAMDSLFQKLSWSPPDSEFIPKLQSLTLCVYSSISVLGFMSCIFSWSHRKDLRLTVNTAGFRTEDGDLDEISQLVEKGYNIRLV